MTEADVLRMLSLSTEVGQIFYNRYILIHAILQFEQLQVRENEIQELLHLLEDAPCSVDVNILKRTSTEQLY
jgi:hypothetical protein